MSSPICTVKDGAGSPQVTTTGYATVTPAATVTIALADVTGVGAWSITCIATDETTDAATITASLTVNVVNKTATFTAPAASKAMIFRSQVNIGRDANGENAALTTTFKIATLTAVSLVVGALNEELEHSSTFGWLPIVNGIVRSYAGATPDASASVKGIVQLTNNLGGTATAPTVVGLTIPSEAQGDILYRGSSAWVRLPASTSGYLLSTGGAAANPSWIAPASIATGGWETILEIDFTTEATQDFIAGGDVNKTLTTSGKILQVNGTARCSAFGNINGTGVQIVISSTGNNASAYIRFNSGTQSAMGSFPGGEEWEYTCAITVSAQSVTNEQCGISVEDFGVAAHATVGFRYTGSAQNIFFQYADPGGSQVVGSSTNTNLTDTVFQARIKNASYEEVWSGPFTGGMGGTWPTTMRLRGTRNHTVQTAQWMPLTQEMTAGCFGSNLSSIAGRTVTIKYVRIRRKAVT